MKTKSIIFDLDGTLVDSLPGIEASTRYALERRSLAMEFPPIRSVIGPPIAKMFAQLWPNLASDELAQLVGSFREHYDGDGCLLSLLYPGARETLCALKERGADLFVLTNKPAQASRTILAHLDILRFFEEVVSPDVCHPPFLTKSDGGRYLQKKHALEPVSTFLVGDGADDLATAQSCGFTFVAAGYGYGSVAGDESGNWPVAKTFPDIMDIVV